MSRNCNKTGDPQKELENLINISQDIVITINHLIEQRESPIRKTKFML